LRRDHKHDWRISSGVAGSGYVIACRCGGLVRVLLVGGKVRPEVLRDGGHMFTRRDAERSSLWRLRCSGRLVAARSAVVQVWSAVVGTTAKAAKGAVRANEL